MRHIGRLSRLSQCAGVNNTWGYLGGLQQSDLQQHTAGLVCRQHATAAGGAGHNTHRIVLALIQEELGKLSIPSGELKQLASSGLSDAALTAWALTKTSIHPAADQASVAQQQLQYLLSKLDGAMMRQQAAGSSPTAELLWRVALAAAQQQLQGMCGEELEACVEYRAARATIRLQAGGDQPEAALELLQQQLPQYVDTSPRNALSHPNFWQLACAAADAQGGLAQDLSLLGYDLQAAAAADTEQLQQVEQLLGLNAANLQQQLLGHLNAKNNILLPEQQVQLVQAVSSNAGARSLLGQLQLLEVLSTALGLSAVQLVLPPSSAELVRRLSGKASPPPVISEQLAHAIQAAAPALCTAVGQLPAQSLAQPGVAGLLQLINSKPEFKAFSQALTSWRAAAAAAGSLPVLASLSQAEVAGLSQAQAEAVTRHVLGLEAQGRLLMRQAAAGELVLAELSASDADALAWKVHTGGTAAAEELVQLLLQQASDAMSRHQGDADAAEEALTALSAGFELEEATSRRSTAAPPSAYLMAGIPQMQVAELSRSALPAAGVQQADGSSSSPGQLITAERLVRDLAMLLTSSSSSSSSSRGGAAAESHQAAAQRLHVVAHDLPRVLSGPLQELLAALPNSNLADAGSLQRQQQQLRAFLQVVASELPQQLPPAQGSRCASSSSSSWSAAGQSQADQAAAEGLLHLLGEQDCGEVLQHGAERHTRSRASGRGAGGEDDGDGDDQGHLHGWLANIHHDQDMQRYMQIEFDPALNLDMVHTPRGWRDGDLFVSGPEFLDAMKPLLDTYLAAQGERPIQDLEWQVYRDAALAEAEQVEVEVARHRHAAGHSPFNNSRADEAFLRERLDAGIPKDSVLYAAAHKYLSASFRNRTWRFAQRKRMVDVLIRIADHLSTHPPRSHRGSPFSALFQQDGPPIVPRISSQVQPGADTEAYALPPGFGAAAPAQ